MSVRLGAIYAAYFASLGVMLPYLSVYLDALGFSASQIGLLLAIATASKIVAPIIWGALADHTGAHLPLVRWAGLLSLLCFLPVPWLSGFGAIALALALNGFFWNAILPQLEAVTLASLRGREDAYGHIRLWGSVGFVVTVVALGPLLDNHGTGLVPWTLIACFLGVWLLTLSLPPVVVATEESEPLSLISVLRGRQVVLLFAVCFLLQLSHGPYYTFFTLYLDGFGYARSTSGLLWAWGVVAEVAVFLVMAPLLRRWTAWRLMLVAAVLTAIRWFMTAWLAGDLLALIVAQTLHMASYGLYHAAGINLIHKLFPSAHHGRAQALYSSVSFGAGGALGAWASGLWWESAGPEACYLAAAVTALLAGGLAWLGGGGRKVY